MEYRTELRILNIMSEDFNISRKERRTILYKFDELRILRKDMPVDLGSLNRRTYILAREEYVEKMLWINDFFQSKGYEQLFLNPYSFEQSIEDYDYYYDIKTPSEYKKAEEDRKAMLEILQKTGD